ncbi:MAG: Coenzyme F420 hydrogenase/dehydrogenase, beta subunit C-terminal domain [Acidimicrobiales bacterium]
MSEVPPTAPPASDAPPSSDAPAAGEPPAKERWRFQWAELYEQVVTSGLCTGCAGCVVACPHDVLGYDEARGVYRPFHLEAELGPGDCGHGQRGCTSCTRACPRFGGWEGEADMQLFGRHRLPEEQAGVAKDVLLARATDPEITAVGQDGGLVSAILCWALDNDVIDAALVSLLEGDGSTWRAVPSVARTKAEVLAASGSRYTYSANTLAYKAAVDHHGADRVALVGMSCQASIPAIMKARKAGKIARRMSLSIGLLCSKTFDDSIFEELFEARYGIARADITKMNVKGAMQIWTADGQFHEIPLKECHPFTREGCKSCPDFAAEHADISTGGIGAFNDWTLTIVRTDKGREIIEGMLAAGAIETRPADDDPGAVALLRKLAIVSRRRWPEVAVAGPRLGTPARTGGGAQH